MGHNPYDFPDRAERVKERVARQRRIDKAELAFLREARKYVRYIRRQIRNGSYDSSRADEAFFRAHDVLVMVEKDL